MRFGLGYQRRHMLVLVSMLVFMTMFAQAAPVAGQEATPTATPVATPDVDSLGVPTGLEEDLAAMVLLPHEIDQEFESDGGVLRDIDGVVDQFAEDLDMDSQEATNRLQESGFVAQYDLLGAVLDDTDPSNYARYGVSYVFQYEDSNGAEAGFDLIEDESLDPDAQDVQGAPQLGDQSELTRVEGTDPSTGQEFASVDYTFRSDNLVAGILVTAYDDGDVPTEDAIVALAEQQLERIETVVAEGASGLFLPILRVESSGAFMLAETYEEYGMIDGEIPVALGESVDDYEARAAYWNEANVESMYRVRSYFHPEGVADHDQDLTIVSYVYRFSSEADAEGHAMNGASRYVENYGDVFASMTVLEDVPEFDGVVTGVAYDFAVSDEATASGMVYWIQAGSDVVAVQADRVGGVTESSLVTLAQEQIACLETPDVQCDPVPVPDDLAA